MIAKWARISLTAAALALCAPVGFTAGEAEDEGAGDDVTTRCLLRLSLPVLPRR